MALTPEKAKELAPSEKMLADAIEQAIDKRLREEYTGVFGQKVRVEQPGPVTARTRLEVCNRFSGAGWVISLERETSLMTSISIWVLSKRDDVSSGPRDKKEFN